MNITNQKISRVTFKKKKKLVILTLNTRKDDQYRDIDNVFMYRKSTQIVISSNTNVLLI